ncbi:hypothetical protein [Ornithinimicrobium kibberense]|uniref:hypothetical protein n=1 Tax=Ornithinimicrobium kibberense TaxID=282060 RepID=UPI003614E8CD
MAGSATSLRARFRCGESDIPARRASRRHRRGSRRDQTTRTCQYTGRSDVPASDASHAGTGGSTSIMCGTSTSM